MTSLMTFSSPFIMIQKLCQYLGHRAIDFPQLSQEKPKLYLGLNPLQAFYSPVMAFIYLSS